MTIEKERKFLTCNDAFKKQARSYRIRQGFINLEKERVVRVRIIKDKAFITLKGLTKGISRKEFEYPIPVSDAEIMLNEMCVKPIIEKTRYEVKHEGLLWEVDEFHGDNKGLKLAEVELPSEDRLIKKPSWVGKEVSHDPRYFNSNLVKKPYENW